MGTRYIRPQGEVVYGIRRTGNRWMVTTDIWHGETSHEGQQDCCGPFSSRHAAQDEADRHAHRRVAARDSHEDSAES